MKSAIWSKPSDLISGQRFSFQGSKNIHYRFWLFFKQNFKTYISKTIFQASYFFVKTGRMLQTIKGQVENLVTIPLFVY